MARSRTAAIMSRSAVLALIVGSFTLADSRALMAADGSAKKIAAGKPVYRAKTHRAWKTKGRIVGAIRECPGCEVKALDPKTKKAIATFTVKPGGKAYELQWLRPGKYILLVTAAGYEALDVHNLVVRAKNDLRVDLEF